MDKKYTYMLRYTIAPDCCEDERIAELIDFSKAAEIDEVMFFVDCEEINTGHITPEEQERWLKKPSKRPIRSASPFPSTPGVPLCTRTEAAH